LRGALAESLEREKATSCALTSALDQQTATSEILRTISSSPTDVRPVFQSIVDSAKRLLGAFSVTVAQRAGDELHLAALSSVSEAGDARVRAAFPFLIKKDSTAGPIEPFVMSILSQKPFVVSDAQTQPNIDEGQREIARARGFRSQLVVPLLREQSAGGVISVTRREAGGFTENEVALLQTFADQAVIAIENVRLFNETKERLEQQTATAEILRVISSSPKDTQPVFDAIAASAARLCTANDAQVLRAEGEVLRLVAAFGAPSMPSVRRLTRGHLVGRAVMERDSLEEDPDVPSCPGRRALS
jgi:two-component system, NtrC family, sensor kinase